VRQAKNNLEDAIEAADRIHSAAIQLLRWLRASDRKSGIGPAQLSALSVLVFGGPQSLVQLAQAEQVRPPTMSRIVNGLVEAGLATSTTDQRDRRGIVVRPTEQGIRLMNAARQRRVEILARAIQRMSKKEIGDLSKAAEMMESLRQKL
jgi:DNA-binding MarR family transcriptional regulator